MIFAEATLKIHIVLLNLSWKGLVTSVLHGSSLFAVDSLSVFVLQVLDRTVKLLLKHADSFNRIFSHVFGKVWVEVSEVIKVDVEPVFGFGNQTCDLLLVLATAHVVAD